MNLLKIVFYFYCVITPLCSFATTITQTQSTQTSIDQPYTHWGLTKTQWSRFEELKSGSRGTWSPNLDPITLLGIEAKNEQERKALAEKWVKLEFERAEKELAFQRAVDVAWKKLYPNTLPISEEKFTVQAQPVNGRLLLFASLNCPACDKILDDVLATSYPIDIYITGNPTDAQINQWASDKKINPNLVKFGQITLNRDTGQHQILAEDTLPALLQRIEGNWRLVSL